jgi:hypothetical protein
MALTLIESVKTGVIFTSVKGVFDAVVLDLVAVTLLVSVVFSRQLKQQTTNKKRNNLMVKFLLKIALYPLEAIPL